MGAVVEGALGDYVVDVVGGCEAEDVYEAVGAFPAFVVQADGVV